MRQGKKLLFVGETCFAQTTEFKGTNSFSGIRYHESGYQFRALLEHQGFEVTHIPCHLVPRDYPRTVQGLAAYDVVLFSDVGADTFLLLPDMVRTGVRVPNLLKVTAEYVRQGGGFGMIGGYMTFQGINGSARYHASPIEEILPVTILPYDDRVEVPDGADLRCNPASSAVLEGFPEEWPYILGYNKVEAKQGADVLVSYNGDPIISLWSCEKGRTLAYATDCAPHWAPSAITGWEFYERLWGRLCSWLAGGQ
jgi:uncharacterized membrane protein